MIAAMDFVVHGLAVFRLTVMVTKESGPGWVFKRLRRKVKRDAPKATHMDEGIECPWCMSMQFALAVATARFFLAGNPVYDVIIFALALSGVAIVINQQFTKTK